MGKVFDTIEDSVREMIERQRMFFVATAPISESGLINLSPKGLSTLRILDEKTVVYLDLVGSGVETIAHLKENGRMVMMFCAFEGAPKIVRLHGRGEVIEPKHPEFETLRGLFEEQKGLRAFIRLHCERISDSCGYGVPVYEFKEDRNQLPAWAKSKGIEGVNEYKRKMNTESLEGLPGLDLETEV